MRALTHVKSFDNRLTSSWRGSQTPGSAGTVLYDFEIRKLDSLSSSMILLGGVEICVLCSSDHRLPHTTPVVMATKVPQSSFSPHSVTLFKIC